jgi:hypothetical protein
MARLLDTENRAAAIVRAALRPGIPAAAAVRKQPVEKVLLQNTSHSVSKNIAHVFKHEPHVGFVLVKGGDNYP